MTAALLSAVQRSVPVTVSLYRVCVAFVPFSLLQVSRTEGWHAVGAERRQQLVGHGETQRIHTGRRETRTTHRVSLPLWLYFEIRLFIVQAPSHLCGSGTHKSCCGLSQSFFFSDATSILSNSSTQRPSRLVAHTASLTWPGTNCYNECTSFSLEGCWRSVCH